MPRLEHVRSGGHSRDRVLRIAGSILAAALGVAAVWLIVTSQSAKAIKIGALLGFWALLLAAYPVLGTRHPRVIEAGTGRDLEVRPAGRLERMDDASVRADYERRLQQLLRQEIQTALGPELSELRSEVAALRSEILEKVGGQIRLERIETTRVIGSDIEALHHEVRQLKGGQWHDVPDGLTIESDAQLAANGFADTEDLPSVAQSVAPEVAGVPGRHEVAESSGPEPTATAGPPAREGPPDTMEAVQIEPVRPWLVQRPTASRPQPAEEPPTGSSQSSDPFASLPRIRPYTEISLDDIDDSIADSHSGRRRHERSGDDGERDVIVSADAPDSGKHAGAEADSAAGQHSGRRRRRESDDDDDVLARILQREGNRG